MEQPNFSQRRARLIQLKQRREGRERDVPRRKPSKAVFGKCPACGGVTPKSALVRSLYVCPACGYHHPIGAYLRLSLLLDSHSFRELDEKLTAANPLDFPGYEEKLRAARRSTGLAEALVTARGMIDGRSVVAAVLDSQFLMGSMGAAVGEKLTRAVEYAGRTRRPLIICSASGGAPDARRASCP